MSLSLKEKSRGIQCELSLKEAELLSAQHSISELKVSVIAKKYVHVSADQSFVSLSLKEKTREAQGKLSARDEELQSAQHSISELEVSKRFHNFFF